MLKFHLLIVLPQILAYGNKDSIKITGMNVFSEIDKSDMSVCEAPEAAIVVAWFSSISN